MFIVLSTNSPAEEEVAVGNFVATGIVDRATGDVLVVSCQLPPEVDLNDLADLLKELEALAENDLMGKPATSGEQPDIILTTGGITRVSVRMFPGSTRREAEGVVAAIADFVGVSGRPAISFVRRPSATVAAWWAASCRLP